MFDIRSIRDNPAAFDAGLARRGLPPQADALRALDARRREALTRAQEIQTRRNAAAKQIGALKAKGEDATAVITQVAADKDAQAEAEAEAQKLDDELEAALAVIPNLPAADVPEGRDESANVELRKVGTPPKFDFKPKEHFELGEALRLMDFEAAARMSGARFVVLKGALARLERALGAFMLDLQTGENGYTEIAPPYLVRDGALYGTGQLPKFADDLFVATTQHWLIPTAEVPLTNLVREQILDESALPIRVTALTPCFRSEAGAAGKDTRGMIRQHQFDKVELVSITTPEQSDAEHERMTKAAEEVLKRLGLSYRVIVLCTGDMGFAARKTYDIEVWLPGQDIGKGAYREISSCSNCGDFQARRMKARFRRTGEDKGTHFVHTLNGSGLAVGRTLIAVMENYQTAAGTIRVPDALRPYMGGLAEIGPDRFAGASARRG
ncbi:MAG: serine--tRNA ligase [Alphaproteobacteria bacterium]|nr:serine--tRNA ligase [Alphaproteobacteria bacterium]